MQFLTTYLFTQIMHSIYQQKIFVQFIHHITHTINLNKILRKYDYKTKISQSLQPRKFFE